MSITLRRIRSFITVAQAGGFRRAADELAISQPALSAHVKELEEQLGVPLFRRTTRQVRLTDNGELFLTRVRRALSDLESVILEVKEQAAIQRGRVVVATVPSIAANVLPRILPAFMKAHPGIAVHIYDDRAESIEGRVVRSEVDFAIGPAIENSTDLEFENVVDDRFLAIFPNTHPDAQARTITLRQLLAYPLITMRPGLNMRQVLDAAVAKEGLAIRPAHEVYHHDTLMGMVESGLGVGTLPALTVSVVRNPKLAFATIANPAVTRQIGFTKRRGEPLSPAATEFSYAARIHLLNGIHSPLRPRKSGRKGR